MDCQKHSFCEGKYSCKNITESSAFAKEIGKLSKRIEILEDDSQIFKNEFAVR